MIHERCVHFQMNIICESDKNPNSSATHGKGCDVILQETIPRDDGSILKRLRIFFNLLTCVNDILTTSQAKKIAKL